MHTKFLLAPIASVIFVMILHTTCRGSITRHHKPIELIPPTMQLQVFDPKHIVQYTIHTQIIYRIFALCHLHILQ